MLEEAAWYQALTLAERKTGTPTRVDSERAGQRLERWRGQSPFESDEVFQRRLARDGLTEERFLELLGEEPEDLRDRLAATPEWLRELAGALETNGAPPSPPDLGETLLRAGQGDPRVALLKPFERIIAGSFQRLAAVVEPLAREHPETFPEPQRAVGLWLPHLLRQLVLGNAQTLVLEMHVARLQGQLSGDTAEERFASFVRRLGEEEPARALCLEYPVLVRHVQRRIRQWLEFGSDFFHHLAADLSELHRIGLLARDAGSLEGLQTGLADLHHGGRSVVVLVLADGSRVVYKPRPLGVEARFQELLRDLSRRLPDLGFRTLRVLDRGAYGWMEHAEHRPCRSREEVKRFYRRQGGYLAVLHALAATDFHYENLIADGEHPVLVDLESLFHPIVGQGTTPEAGEVATRRLGSSVLTVGLLPQRMFARDDSPGLDVSGIGFTAGQKTGPVPGWKGAGTDEMRLERIEAQVGGGRHRPVLDGEEMAAGPFIDRILEGFSTVYRGLLEHRTELSSPDGPLESFRNERIRVIVRPTRAYALLLREGFHPDLMRDALERDRFFDRLWLDAEHRPHLEAVIPHEHEALLRGDVPFFWSRPDSTSLHTAQGVKIDGLVDASGMEVCRSRLQGLDEEDLRLQSWILRASLAPVATPGEGASHPSLRPPDAVESPASEALIELASNLAERIHSSALRDDGDIGWLGLARGPAGHWNIMPLGLDLYGGLSGVCLFLAHLASLGGEPRHRSLAEESLTTVRRRLADSPHAMEKVGGFEGWGGVLYLWTHLAALWRDPSLVAEAEGFLDFLPDRIDHDTARDIMTGAAGCLASLLSFHQSTGSTRALELAERCGDHLVADALDAEGGLAWETAVRGSRPLTGFAHGAAGIAWALLHLAAQTGRDEYRRAALGGITYERSQLNSEVGNWPDFRSKDPNKPTFFTGWCYGAPGIGLSRLDVLEQLDGEARREIELAVTTTLDQGFGRNHSLCHGDLGNYELLALAGASEAGRWTEPAQRMAAAIAKGLREDGPQCATPLAVESPELMTGLAGIGYGLLRLARPSEVPSALLLKPPRGSPPSPAD